MYEGTEFQMDEQENENLFWYNSKWGVEAYTWKLEDERKSVAWL